MGRIIINEQLFLPELMRLNTYNWEVYKIAIHALCHANGLQDHLEKHVFDGAVCAPLDDPGARRWAEDDQLCKALIVLNIHPEMLERACDIRAAYLSEERGAAYLWELVVRYEGCFPAPRKRREVC